jgi:hypothetical protein
VLANIVWSAALCDQLLRNYRRDTKLFCTRIDMYRIMHVSGSTTHVVGIQHDVTAETG